jgi:hypothetical protein
MAGHRSKHRNKRLWLPGQSSIKTSAGASSDDRRFCDDVQTMMSIFDDLIRHHHVTPEPLAQARRQT